jgi:hypothetical protein
MFMGNYFNGVKDGKFTLEKIYNNKIIKVNGTFDKGKKNGIFKIFELTDIQEKEVYSEEFINNFIKSKLIENKKFFEYKEKHKIFCMEKFEKDKLYLLLGSYEYLLIYNINIDNNEINHNKKIFLFRKGEINDIIILKDDRILLCSSNNRFKLIDINF